MSAASLSVAQLRLSAPDDRVLFNDLNLIFGRERTGLVGRNGVGKSTLLKVLAGDVLPAGGRVVTHGLVHMLQQIVQVAGDETIADLFGVRDGFDLLRKAEAGRATIDELANADWTLDARAAEALSQMSLDMPLDLPLVRLSGGQRTRVALAGAIFARPDFLLLDEPTNDLDREGRRAVIALLEGWRTGAVVVSHDRELLETMDAIVELTSLGAQRYGGNWSHFQARKETELAAAEQDLASAEQRLAEIARKTQQVAERKQRRDAAGSRKAARGDMPRILIGQRRDNAEKSGGENVRLADRLRTDATRNLDRAKERIERVEGLSVTIAPTGVAPSMRVLDAEHITFGYADAPAILRDVSLSLRGRERVAIAGANGTGKSTLLNIIVGTLAPWSGDVALHVPYAFFDQRVSILDAAETIAENFARLNPQANRNMIHAALARFQFRAEAAERAVDTLSGGQMLRAALACVLGGPNPPPLLILDEPTNHLDIESIDAVEAGLRAYDGALLVVSHDRTFLDNINLDRTLDLTEQAI